MDEDLIGRLRSGEDGLEYAAADEIERLRAALAEIANAPSGLRDATPSEYARGFNDGRWRMQQIASAALAGEKADG